MKNSSSNGLVIPGEEHYALEHRKRLLQDYKFMKKDKNTIPILADLYCIEKEEVEKMIENSKRKPAFRWDEDRRFRLRALESQGMRQIDIAKELGCSAQCLADFKRREKLKGEKSKRKEPSVIEATDGSRKNTSADNTSSINNYTTYKNESQELFGNVSIGQFFGLEKKIEDARAVLHTVIIFLETARRAGVLWSSSEDRCQCCEMYCEMLGLILGKCGTLEEILK